VQINKIKKWKYKPSEREVIEKVDEIVSKVNILIGDHNYIDENEI